MDRKTVWLALSCIITISVVLASCGTTTTPTTTATTIATTTATTKPTTTTTTTTNAGTEVPQYGGTIIYRIAGDPANFDPYLGGTTTLPMCLETIATVNWVEVPPNVWDFRTRFNPVKYLTGLIAESWETQDLQTIIFHIRKGVHWQNKPPMNGREMNAHDVEYSWHRLFGLGSGYTKPSIRVSVVLYGPPVSVTATDDWTVVMKFAKPSLEYVRQILDDTPYPSVLPREVIEKYGDLSDWHNVVGTGPFILDDYVSGSCLTYSRNPNYWGYDQQYPKNRLPYVDRAKIVIIVDPATAMAGLRSGKIDRLINLNNQQAESLAKTNSELVQDPYQYNATTIVMPVDRKPFSDIKVRKALQMSLDLKTIAKEYLSGLTDGTPVSQIVHKGYRAEYADWPQGVKDGYAYNTEGAKKLLAEAGYPNGFSTTITVSASASDMDLYQIIKSYFHDIGVEAKIEVMEAVTWRTYVYAGKAEMCTTPWPANAQIPPLSRLSQLTKSHVEYAAHHINDPHYQELYDKAAATIDEEQQRKLCVEADMYAVSQQWMILVQPHCFFNINQPWIKRYSIATEVGLGYKLARIWIDQDLKKAMGR